MKRTLIGLAKLTRFNEYVYFVLIATLLGVTAAQGEFSWQLLIVVPANWLAVSFAFMINDIEDAPDDAFSKKNFQRNPVSAGLISSKTAWVATILVGFLSAGLFALLGFWTLVCGVASLFLGFLYSIKSVRLKTMPYVELVSYGLLLAGLPFLCGYFSFTVSLNRTWFWPFTFMMAVCILTVLQGELKDLERDELARLRHTAVLLGERAATNLMIAMIILMISAGVVSFFVINLAPAWVVLIAALLAIVLIIPAFIKFRRGDPNINPQGLFRKPLERAAALALIFQFILPWLNQIFRLGWF